MATSEQNQSIVSPGFWYDGAWRSGEHITLSTTEPGLLYGATVFTTLRVYGGLSDPRMAWAAHQARLYRSMQSFCWAMPDWDRVEAGVVTVSGHYPVVRVTLFPDGREWITGRQLPVDLAQRQQQGIVACVMDQAVGARSLPQHKTGNYLTPWFGLQHARSRKAQETILVDAQGHWLETCTGSLWGWADGIWYTPELAGGILPGIMRERVIQGLRCHNREVLECPWHQELIQRFTIVAYSNCVVEIVPLRVILRNAETLEYRLQPELLQELSSALVPGYSQMS